MGGLEIVGYIVLLFLAWFFFQALSGQSKGF